MLIQMLFVSLIKGLGLAILSWAIVHVLASYGFGFTLDGRVDAFIFLAAYIPSVVAYWNSFE